MVPMLEEGSGLIAGEDFFVGYSPERIDPGNRVWTLTNTPKVVSGINESLPGAGRPLLPDPGRPHCPGVGNPRGRAHQAARKHLPARQYCPGQRTGRFRRRTGHRRVGGHWRRGLQALRLHALPSRARRRRATACPSIPSYLSWRVSRRIGKSFRFVELANDINEHMPDYVVRRLIDALNRDGKALRGARVLLLGMAYKRNTGDAREAPSASVAKQLLSYGAEVRAVDPHVLDSDVMNGVVLVDATHKEIASADAVVLLTDHDAFDLDAHQDTRQLRSRHAAPDRRRPRRISLTSARRTRRPTCCCGRRQR